jgi:hypothetical protein
MVLLEVQHCDYRAVWLFTYHSDHVASGWQSIYNDAAHHCLSFFMGYNPLSAHTSQRVPQQIGRGCAPEPEFCAITTIASHTSKRLHHHDDSCFAGHDNSHMQHSVVITIQSSSWRSETQHSATKSDTQKPGSKKLPQFSPGRKPHTIITAMTVDQISKRSQQPFDSCHTGTAIFQQSVEQYSNYGHLALPSGYKAHHTLYAITSNIKFILGSSRYNHTITDLQGRLPILATPRVRLKHLCASRKLKKNCAAANPGRD